MMQDNVGIIRQEDEMLEALKGIEELKKRAATVAAPGNRQYNPGWHTALDLKCLLLVAEAVTRSAIERKESRGAHTREDYKSKEEKYDTVNTVLRKDENGEMQVALETIPEMPQELTQIINDHK